jgi:hypothetical protein
MDVFCQGEAGSHNAFAQTSWAQRAHDTVMTGTAMVCHCERRDWGELPPLLAPRPHMFPVTHAQ